MVYHLNNRNRDIDNDNDNYYHHSLPQSMRQCAPSLFPPSKKAVQILCTAFFTLFYFISINSSHQHTHSRDHGPPEGR
jgi:hypothetical protein